MLIVFYFYSSGSSPLFQRPLCCLTFSLVLRRQQEAELKLLEEETSKRVEVAIRTKVEESLNSVEIKVEIQRQLEEGRKKLLTEVAALLEKEKEAALVEARNKEVIFRLPCCFCMTSHFLFLLWWHANESLCAITIRDDWTHIFCFLEHIQLSF